VLEEMLASGEIDAGKAEAARAKYSAIHDALVQAMTGEHALLDKAKAMKSQLDVPRPPPLASVLPLKPASNSKILMYGFEISKLCWLILGDVHFRCCVNDGGF
jgi:hypothetical protein